MTPSERDRARRSPEEIAWARKWIKDTLEWCGMSDAEMIARLRVETFEATREAAARLCESPGEDGFGFESGPEAAVAVRSMKLEDLADRVVSFEPTGPPVVTYGTGMNAKRAEPQEITVPTTPATRHPHRVIRVECDGKKFIVTPEAPPVEDGK